MITSQYKLSDFGRNENPSFNSSFSVYQELKDLGYVDGHKSQILFLLWDLKPHNCEEVVKAGGKQYNARILELRREGFQILSLRVSSVKFQFQLLNHSKRWKE